MASTGEEIEFQPKQTRKSGAAAKWADTKKFFYNPDDKAILGRTGMSWAKIGLFYLIFYAFLAAFFATMLAVFFTTVDRNYPSVTGMLSLIKGNPGMAYRPMPNFESTLIRFEQGKPSNYKQYADNIQAYLDQYENDKQQGENTVDCNTEGEKVDDDKVCFFDITKQLKGECTRQKDFGYDEGQPCVMLKMNKIYNWKPEPFENNASLPIEAREAGIGDRYRDNYIGVTCEGENPADKENIGNVTFYPPYGFNYQYFPYRNQEGYRQPIVMARFENPANGVLIQVWCKAWAKNIMHHRNDKAGSVHFELLVD